MRASSRPTTRATSSLSRRIRRRHRGLSPADAAAALRGKAAFGEYYATQRFDRAGLHAEIVNRIAFGNKVIDHERITGVRDEPFDVAAVYEVVDGLIARAWFLAAE